MLNPLLITLQNWLATLPPNPTIIVAYSGGRDSHVLLHALKTLCESRDTFSLKAIHINHGLQKFANDWVLHCQSICEQYAISFSCVKLETKPPKGESIEAWAREARYKAFADILLQDEILVTAHHALDQTETFLLQLLRGAGLAGLSAMPQLKFLGKGKHVRPLLHVPAQIIEDYAQNNALHWIEDPSNAQTRFTRNALRHKVIPALKAINPQLTACIGRAAKHCAESQALLEDCLKEAFAASLEKDNALNLGSLQSCSKLKQNALLRMWLSLHELPMPSTKQLETIRHQFLQAAEDAMPTIILKEGLLKRFQNRLYYVKSTLANHHAISWQLSESLKLSDGSHFQAIVQKGQGIALSLVSKEEVEVRFRQGGERCQIAHQSHRRPLKKILQELGIPPWRRQQIPLFYYEECLIAVGSLFICEGWQVKSPYEQGWLIKEVT